MPELNLQDSLVDPESQDTEGEHPEEETSSLVEEEIPSEAIDWEKRYKDLQRDYTRTTQALAEIRKAPTPSAQPASPQSNEQAWLDFFAANPVAALSYLTEWQVEQKLAPLKAEAKTRQMTELKSKYSDASEVLPLIEQLEQDLPQVAKDPTLAMRSDRIELLYHLAKTYYGLPMNPPQPRLQKSTAPKTLSAHGSRPAEKTPDEDLDEAIKEAKKRKDREEVVRLSLMKAKTPFSQ